MRVYHDTESFVKLVSEIHNHKYDYSETVFVQMNQPITVICPEHGRFYPKPGNHKKTGCPGCFEERRGDDKRMTREEFVARLAVFNPNLTLVDDFKTAARDRVLVKCLYHGTFKGSPTRLLTYRLACKECLALSVTARNKTKSKDKILAAIADLPKHVTLKTIDPGWSTPTVFTCKEHGDFVSRLDNLKLFTHICKKCSSDARRGKALVTYGQYANYVATLYPTPPHPISLVEEDYQGNVGKKLVALRCAEHGVFTANRDSVNNARLTSPCPYCKKTAQSTGENQVLDFVRSLIPVVGQGNRQVISPKELDIVAPAHKLSLEYCGLYWHSTLKVRPMYHISKLKAARDNGWGLVTIFEDEWREKRAICESIIKHRLGLSDKVFHARKSSVRRVDFQEVKDFLNVNHIQGFVPSQRYFVLEDTSGIKAVASFSFNRLKKDDEWELVRYCSALGTVVVGGLPKLVKHFLRAEGVKTLMSYCCLRWFTGAGYEKAGFTLEGYTKPTYFYTNRKERRSRYVCKKHKLKTWLPDFDEKLTETQNMANAGYVKIYDCGNAVYRFTL